MMIGPPFLVVDIGFKTEMRGRLPSPCISNTKLLPFDMDEDNPSTNASKMAW